METACLERLVVCVCGLANVFEKKCGSMCVLITYIFDVNVSLACFLPLHRFVLRCSRVYLLYLAVRRRHATL